MKSILEFFDRESKEILLLTDKLHKALTDLRYESRAWRAKNIKAVHDILQNLEGILQRHRRFQEGVIFPFLEAHIPRHEAAIHFLEAEHEDIKTNKNKLKSGIRKLPAANGNLNNGKIYECGIYLVSLLRHHVGFEQRFIHQSVRKELRADEKAVMTRSVSGWLKEKENNGDKAVKRGEGHE